MLLARVAGEVGEADRYRPYRGPPGHKLLKRWLKKRGRGAAADLAASVGVSKVAVHYWWTGVTPPSRDNVFAIEVATNGAVPAASWPMLTFRVVRAPRAARGRRLEPA